MDVDSCVQDHNLLLLIALRFYYELALNFFFIDLKVSRNHPKDYAYKSSKIF